MGLAFPLAKTVKTLIKIQFVLSIFFCFFKTIEPRGLKELDGKCFFEEVLCSEPASKGVGESIVIRLSHITFMFKEFTILNSITKHLWFFQLDVSLSHLCLSQI